MSCVTAILLSLSSNEQRNKIIVRLSKLFEITLKYVSSDRTWIKSWILIPFPISIFNLPLTHLCVFHNWTNKWQSYFWTKMFWIVRWCFVFKHILFIININNLSNIEVSITIWHYFYLGPTIAMFLNILMRKQIKLMDTNIKNSVHKCRNPLFI